MGQFVTVSAPASSPETSTIYQGRTSVTAPAKFASSLDNLKARLTARPELGAVRFLEEIRAAGYPGSLSHLKCYGRRVHARPPDDPMQGLKTKPAQQAQVDCPEFNMPRGKRCVVFVAPDYPRLLRALRNRRRKTKAMRGP